MTAAASTIARVADLTTRLGEVLAAETQFLKERRPSELAAMQDQKARLAQEYDAEMAALRDSPAVLAAAAPDEIEQMKTIFAGFRDILDRHNRALFIAKTVTERLIRAVTNEVASRDKTVHGYSNKALPRALTAPQGGRPVSLALNQVV